jgi:hypothetical protein
MWASVSGREMGKFAFVNVHTDILFYLREHYASV